MTRKSKRYAWRSGAMAIAVLAATAMLIMTNAAQAQVQALTCGPRTALVGYLGTKHRDIVRTHRNQVDTDGVVML